MNDRATAEQVKKAIVGLISGELSEGQKSRIRIATAAFDMFKRTEMNKANTNMYRALQEVVYSVETYDIIRRILAEPNPEKFFKNGELPPDTEIAELKQVTIADLAALKKAVEEAEDFYRTL